MEQQNNVIPFQQKEKSRIFVKMYVNAVKDGLIADMGADRWQTFCVLASYMDKNGECYPTQYQLANALGVARETANRRIKKLCDYRWNGKPLVTKEQSRDYERQTWDNVRYKIFPNRYLAIFDSE